MYFGLILLIFLYSIIGTFTPGINLLILNLFLSNTPFKNCELILNKFNNTVHLDAAP